MGPEERRQSAWKFLSTTQGRRSAVTTIGKLIIEHLSVEGFEIVEEPWDKDCKAAPKAAHKWELDLGEEGTTQSSFSAIDVAARALSSALLDQIGNTTARGDQFCLEVTTVDKYANRVVGWVARLT